MLLKSRATHSLSYYHIIPKKPSLSTSAWGKKVKAALVGQVREKIYSSANLNFARLYGLGCRNLWIPVDLLFSSSWGSTTGHEALPEWPLVQVL